MTPAFRARRTIPAPFRGVAACLVGLVTLLVGLLWAGSAAAYEPVSGLDRVIPTEGAGSEPLPGEGSSLLDAEAPPPALARPRVQTGPDGKHTDDHRVAGGEVIALSAPSAARCIDEGEAARAGAPRESARVPAGARIAHPARGPPAFAA